jgi:hypothetical protein
MMDEIPQALKGTYVGRSPLRDFIHHLLAESKKIYGISLLKDG